MLIMDSVGCSHMMADIVAGNSSASAPAYQIVKRSNPDVPTNALLNRCTGTVNPVLPKRRRVGNVRACKDVCNFGVASDVMQQHICTCIFNSYNVLPLQVSAMINIKDMVVPVKTPTI
ncbi:hypothetical protein Tco_0329398 [Tanacetum coccineum]